MNCSICLFSIDFFGLYFNIVLWISFSMLSLLYFLILSMRFFRYLFMFFIFSLFLGTTFALFSVDDFIMQFQTQQANLSFSEKQAYYKKVLNNLNLLAVRNRDDADQVKLYTELQNYVSAQIESLWSFDSAAVSFTLLPSSSGMNILNVDLDRVRATWLSWHNTERQTKWLTPFTYSSALEGTASTRAQHLADIKTTTHRRKSTDGYYSYASIKSWFVDQWIVFSDTGQKSSLLFTENIWWNIYSCKKADCTDDFIAAIKKSRKFFMSEKGKTYKPHYNAIMGDFSRVGMWVALVGNKYYLVAHYTTPLVD